MRIRLAVLALAALIVFGVFDPWAVQSEAVGFALLATTVIILIGGAISLLAAIPRTIAAFQQARRADDST
jgi:hypothetical protein